MIIKPCTCSMPPVTSSREREPGAEHVDIVNEQGRWHAIKDGDIIYLQTLVEPSAAEQKRISAEAKRAQAQITASETRDSALAAIRGKRKAGGRLTDDEVREALDLLLGI